MRTRGLLAAVAAVAVALGLSACFGGHGGSTTNRQAGARSRAPQRGGTLTMLWKGDVGALDLGADYSVSGALVARATQRMVLSYRPGDPSRPVPDLATALPVVSRDGRTVTVHVRSGVRFSPPVNREVTARDVKYGIERGFSKTVANPYVGIYFADLAGARFGAPPGTRIPGIETPDDRTVVFRLTRGTGRLLAGALVMPIAAPVPREYALPFDRHRQSTYGLHQVATGPYMLRSDAHGRVTGYEAGKRIQMVRNPSWDRRTDVKPAYLDEIDVREGNDDATVATRRILSGHGLVSSDTTPPPAELKRALEERRDQVALPGGNLVRYVTLNTKLAPFDDIDVRRAVAAAFDRTAARLAEGGATSGDLATHFIPPGTPGFAEAGGAAGPRLDFLAKPDGQPALAARYLRRAGFASGRYTNPEPILMVGVAGGNDERVSEIGQNVLERLGFHVKLRLVKLETMTSLCGMPRARVQVCPDESWFRDFADAQTMLDPTFNGDSIVAQFNSNASQLDVPAINRAMARATLVVDPAERARAWGAVDRMVTSEAAAVPLSWGRFPLVRSKDVDGVVYRYLAEWDPTFTSLR